VKGPKVRVKPGNPWRKIDGHSRSDRGRKVKSELFRSFQLCPKDFSPRRAQLHLKRQEHIMTDVTTTTPIPRSLISLPGIATHLRPRQAVAAFGRGIVAFLAAYGKALQMAYAAPFTAAPKGPSAAPAEDLNGRDPNW
jgi:hypothetical protein